MSDKIPTAKPGKLQSNPIRDAVDNLWRVCNMGMGEQSTETFYYLLQDALEDARADMDYSHKHEGLGLDMVGTIAEHIERRLKSEIRPLN